MTPKVYLVTSGSYSSYRVIAAFADEQVADEVAASGEGDVETWELYDAVPRKVGWHVITAQPWDSEPHIVHRVDWPWNVDVYVGGPPRKRPKTSVWSYGRGLRAVRAIGLERDSTLKAFRDRLAQVRAEEEGVA